MNLTEYTSICLALDNLCKDMADTLGGWGSADWAEALEEVAALEAALADESKAGGDRLAEDCRALVAEYKQKGTRRAFDARVEGCKQYLTKYGQIGPIVDALEAGEGDLSESDRKALISALNRLSGTYGKLSRVCLQELKGGKAIPGRKRAPRRTAEEVAEAVEKCREAIRQMPAYQDAERKGWVSAFRWSRKGFAPLLWRWLIDSGIATQRPGGSVAWSIEDGTFTDEAGRPITKRSLSAAKSAKEPHDLTLI